MDAAGVYDQAASPALCQFLQKGYVQQAVCPKEAFPVGCHIHFRSILSLLKFSDGFLCQFILFTLHSLPEQFEDSSDTACVLCRQLLHA